MGFVGGGSSGGFAQAFGGEGRCVGLPQSPPSMPAPACPGTPAPPLKPLAIPPATYPSPPPSGPRSTLSVLRPGLSVSELAVSPLPGQPTAVFTLRRAPGDDLDGLIVVSFTNATLVGGVGLGGFKSGHWLAAQEQASHRHREGVPPPNPQPSPTPNPPPQTRPSPPPVRPLNPSPPTPQTSPTLPNRPTPPP